ncbi:MAG: galactokinase [Fimbriimonas sp.]|nr:galactokinase [Fimbriimonas sp.]
MSVENVRSKFVERFGHEPQIIAISPGRINLIGEHTDYNDGFVFPAAIDRGMYVAASVKEPETLTLSVQTGEGVPFRVGRVAPKFTTNWSKYPAGMGWAITQESGIQLPNLEAVVDSTIPIGSGVSSSAAIELAFGVTWSHLAKLALGNRELAILGQRCENQFVGVNCGIMDQMACALGKEGHAIFLDTRSLDVEYAHVPDGLTIVLCDTKKERALTTSAYNERRSQCEEASKLMGVGKLRDADEHMLYVNKSKMTDVVYRRAKHVVSENARCLKFKDALAQGNFGEIGLLMKASHQSLRLDYQVSCDELDAMAQAAWASPGCVGARMTGAGFGGACVALVKTNLVDAFTESVLGLYKLATGVQGEAMSCKVVDGARIVEA